MLGEGIESEFGELTWVFGWFQFALVVGYCWFLELLEPCKGLGEAGGTLKRSSMLDMVELPDDQATRSWRFCLL